MRFIAALLAILGMAVPAFADDNIVIVFDTSGSMGEYMRSAGKTRMVVAQDALVNVLSKVPPTTKVGVVTFEGWIYDLQPVDRASLEAAIRKTRPGGGTPLYQWIKVGADRLLQERAKNLNVGYYKLLVVTDGEAQDGNLNDDGKFGDGSLKPGYLKDIVNRGVVVDAIGLEMKGGHSLRTQINGQYMAGDDPNSIERSLTKAVAEVGFGGDGGVSVEAFDTINQFPEQFVKASLTGLTSFQNQPIGELPPITVVNEDGTTAQVPNPANGPAQAAAGGMGWGWWVLIVLGVIVLVFIIGAILSNQR